MEVIHYSLVLLIIKQTHNYWGFRDEFIAWLIQFAVLYPFGKVVMHTARQTTGLIPCGSSVHFSINKIQLVYSAVLLNCCSVCSAFQHLWAVCLCVFCFTVCLYLGKYLPRKLLLKWLYRLLWLASYCTVLVHSAWKSAFVDESEQLVKIMLIEKSVSAHQSCHESDSRRKHRVTVLPMTRKSLCGSRVALQWTQKITSSSCKVTAFQTRCNCPDSWTNDDISKKFTTSLKCSLWVAGPLLGFLEENCR